MYSLISPQINPLYERTKHEQDMFNSLLQLSDDYYSLPDFKKGLISPALIHQVTSAKKLKLKIPLWAANQNIIYPPSLSLEQSSSERTAKFKASLIKGKTCIDLTGGMGIDSYFLAQQFASLITVEKNTVLGNITNHNFAILNQRNVSFVIGVDAMDFIKNYDAKTDLIYIDPARRNLQGSKVVRFADCEPNFIPNLHQLFNITENILIKGSPLLDIQAACAELTSVFKVYVIAINNECKELLFQLCKDYLGEHTIEVIHFEKDELSQFSFLPSHEKSIMSHLDFPKKYLFEPNNAILKAGAFKWIGQHFNLSKLHLHSHLYTSDHLHHSFPGRCFEVKHCIRVDKKKLHALIPDAKANLSLRNFPGNVATLKKKLGIQDGGDVYIFATTLFDNQKALLITVKVYT